MFCSNNLFDEGNWVQFFFDILKDQEIRPKNCIDQYRGDESSHSIANSANAEPHCILFEDDLNIW